MSWELLMPLICAGLWLMSILLELFMHDREKAKKIELELRKKQREIKALSKKDPKAAMAANKEVMGLVAQNFRLKMKIMLVSFPLFIVLLAVINGYVGVAPLAAGEVSQVGGEFRNAGMSPQTITVEIVPVSGDIQVSGRNAVQVELDDRGDAGDRKTVWWNVTASGGKKAYGMKVTSGNASESQRCDVAFVPKGSISADFSAAAPAELKAVSVESKPIYKPVEVNILGMNLSWFIYYFVCYLIITLILSPLKNRILWGHWGGLKHLEKLEKEKAAKEAGEQKGAK